MISLPCRNSWLVLNRVIMSLSKDVLSMRHASTELSMTFVACRNTPHGASTAQDDIGVFEEIGRANEHYSWRTSCSARAMSETRSTLTAISG